MEEKHLVLYDGYCNLCSSSVRWIIRNDKKKHFRFQPLETASLSGMEKMSGTVVLLKKGKSFDRSTAAIRIALDLRFPWPLLGAIFLVPRFLRDPVYDLLARNRYRWFGKRESCFIPVSQAS